MKSVLTLLLILAAIALVFWIARPLWEEISSIRQENGTIAATLNDLKALEGIRNELLSTYNSIPREKLDRLNEFLPQKSDSGRLLVTLEKLTKNEGVRLRKVEFESKAESKSQTPGVIQSDTSLVNTLNYSFTFSASYESFKSLLSAFEKNLRIIDVTGISFSVGQTNLFEFTLTAKSYYQK